MAEAAHLAWDKKFENRRHLELKRNDEPPFKPILNRELGRTSLSEIHVTDLNGIHLALKRTFPRKKVSDFERNELRLLRQWSKDKHMHIVSLIGSFSYTEKRHGGSFDLYLLIWPVAQCDLAAYLESIDSLAKWLKDNIHAISVDEEESHQVVPAMQQLAAIVLPPRRTMAATRRPRDIEGLLRLASGRLQRSFGCMAEAVAWLHNKNIRHKDLKPSQFLLSQEGLWLTDFGWSKDMSLEKHSVTEGFDQITRKYHSPERDSKNPCGKPEDVFSLGCTFLEMIYRLGQPWVEIISMPGFHQEGWSFHEHLEDLPTWMNEILATKDPIREHAAQIIVRMLETTPNHRPTIMDVVDHLSTGGWSTSLTHNFFLTCCHSRCTPHVAPSLPDGSVETHGTISNQSRPDLARPYAQPVDETPMALRAGTPNMASLRPTGSNIDDLLLQLSTSKPTTRRQRRVLPKTDNEQAQYCEPGELSDLGHGTMLNNSGRSSSKFMMDPQDKNVTQNRIEQDVAQSNPHTAWSRATTRARPDDNYIESDALMQPAECCVFEKLERQRSSSGDDLKTSNTHIEEFLQQMKRARQNGQMQSKPSQNISVTPTIAKQSSSLQPHIPLNTSKDDTVLSWESDYVPALAVGSTGQYRNRPELVRSNIGPVLTRSRTNPISPSNLSMVSSTNATLALGPGDAHADRRKGTSARPSGATRRAEVQLSEENINFFSLQQGSAKNRHGTYVLNSQQRQSSGILADKSSDPPDWSNNFDGDFWCAIEGCSARFREQRSFALHSDREHPNEPPPILSTHEIAKDLIRTAYPSRPLACDFRNCVNSYKGHYREQSLVSHKKRKHGLWVYIHFSKIKPYK